MDVRQGNLSGVVICNPSVVCCHLIRLLLPSIETSLTFISGRPSDFIVMVSPEDGRDIRNA